MAVLSVDQHDSLVGRQQHLSPRMPAVYCNTSIYSEKLRLLIALPSQLMENGVTMENGVHAMLTATEERRPAPKPAPTLLLLILVTTVWEMLAIHNLVTRTLVQVMQLSYATVL